VNEDFPAQPPAAPVPPPVSSSSGLSDSAAAAIAYLTIIPAIIFLVLEPYNKKPFVRFHSFQNIALNVVYLAVWIALRIVSAILHIVPLIGFLFLLVYLAVALCFFIAWLMCIIKASQGQWFKLPVIGDFALKQSQS
jgi:uncharacterized membrane protein